MASNLASPAPPPLSAMSDKELNDNIQALKFTGAPAGAFKPYFTELARRMSVASSVPPPPPVQPPSLQATMQHPIHAGMFANTQSTLAPVYTTNSFFLERPALHPIAMLCERMRHVPVVTQRADPGTAQDHGFVFLNVAFQPKLRYIEIFIDKDDVHVFYVTADGEPGALKDDAGVFPSDTLLAAMRLLLK